MPRGWVPIIPLHTANSPGHINHPDNDDNGDNDNDCHTNHPDNDEDYCDCSDDKRNGCANNDIDRGNTTLP